MIGNSAVPGRVAAGRFIVPLAAVALFAPSHAMAGGGGGDTALTFLFIGLLLLFARIASLVERIGQPAVLGELLVGVAIGNAHLLGIPGTEGVLRELVANPILVFLAELGVVILLFQIGLESSVGAMRRVGAPALAVATVGVIAPFVLGAYVVGPWLLPSLSFHGHLFIGATLTATSIGITGRVFQDLGVLQSREAQIVLGAAVIDDVMGLVILAVVSAMVTAGSVDLAVVGWITLKALAFLFGAIVIGHYAALRFSALFSAIHTGTSMKVAVLIATCLTFAWLAGAIGLAPIVGAFAAGLVLDEVQFKGFAEPALARDLRAAATRMDVAARSSVELVLSKHARHGLEDLVAPVGHLLVPMFFVYTGMQVQLAALADSAIVPAAIGLTAVAFLSKIVAGAVAGDVRRWVVGLGMVPRGEVGLIFAASGKALGVIPDSVFSMIVVVVLLTTVLAPPALSATIRRVGPAERAPTVSTARADD